jgi:hypothetical protein
MRPPLILILLLVLVAGLVRAQGTPAPVGGPYRMAREALPGGAQRSAAGSYLLTGALGQAQIDILAGGSYVLRNGVLAALAPAGDPGERVFANGFEN